MTLKKITFRSDFTRPTKPRRHELVPESETLKKRELRPLFHEEPDGLCRFLGLIIDKEEH